MSVSRSKLICLAIAGVAVVPIITVTIISLISGKQQTGDKQTAATTDSTKQESNGSSSTVTNQITYKDIEKSTRSIIGGYDSTVKNLPSSRRDAANRLLLYTLLQNGVSTAPTDVVIRQGSYAQTLDEGSELYTTTYIVDISSRKQSYRVTDRYSPVPTNDPLSYSTLVTCLVDGELIYPAFDCTDQLIQEGRGY